MTSSVYPYGFASPPPEITDGVDRTFTGADGSWELNLRPTAGTGAAIRIRVWDTATMYVDVPAPIPGGAGDTTPIDVETILVDPDTLDPQDPDPPSLYLTRAERGRPGGVASLGTDGKVPASQLPPSGGGSPSRIEFTAPAAVALSGHRVVTPLPNGTVGYASNNDAEHVAAPLWLTTGAAAPGANVGLLAYGSIEEPSWTWTPGDPIYLGVNGQLTQTPPQSPAALFVGAVGAATGPTTAFIDRQPSVVLI